MITTPYIIWQARPHTRDVDTVINLLHARVTWLQNRGSEQWSTWQRWRPEVEQAVAENRVWILYEETTFKPLGTMTVSYEGDPDFWSEQEQQVSALYLAKLATRPDHAGQNLGKLLLDFAIYLARMHRIEEVRMDVWRTSTRLHHYYEQQGWNHVRTVDAPGRHSGALFTKQVEQVWYNVPPDRLQIRPPVPTPLIDGEVAGEFSHALHDPDKTEGDALNAFDG